MRSWAFGSGLLVVGRAVVQCSHLSSGGRECPHGLRDVRPVGKEDINSEVVSSVSRKPFIFYLSSRFSLPGVCLTERVMMKSDSSTHTGRWWDVAMELVKTKGRRGVWGLSLTLRAAPPLASWPPFQTAASA